MKALTFVCLVVAAAQAFPRQQLQDPIANTPFYQRFFGDVSVSDGSNKIVGGTEATPHAYPWQLHMLMDGGSFCGGALIAPNAVLTAAHCVAGRLSSLTITAGDHDRTKNEGTEQVVKVCTLANDCGEFVNVHPDWNRLNLTGDLAVINLPTPFDIIPGIVEAIPLADNNPDAEDQYDGVTMTVTGWGKTADGPFQTISDVLMEVEVVGISQAVCNETYGIITNNIVCISTVGGKGSCNGDSGGPMIIKGDTIQEVGIVSFGSSAGCEKDYPAGFTRVAGYTAWIKEKAGMIN